MSLRSRLLEIAVYATVGLGGTAIADYNIRDKGPEARLMITAPLALVSGIALGKGISRGINELNDYDKRRRER